MSSINRYPIVLPICLCCALFPHTVTADPPGRRLGDACPKLAPVTGQPAGTIVIDNRMVEKLAREGRIAAVTNTERIPDEPDPGQRSAADDKTIEKWRRAYSRAAEDIRRSDRALRKAGADLKVLEARYATLTKDVQRQRLEPKLDAKAAEIRELERAARQARSHFSGVIRAARKAGARPGWFRGLKRP